MQWIRQQPATYSATIRLGSDETKLEWVADSDFRFFPVVGDDQIGYVLHVIDLAINKVLAAASRREPRDIVDLLTLHAAGCAGVGGGRVGAWFHAGSADRRDQA